MGWTCRIKVRDREAKDLEEVGDCELSSSFLHLLETVILSAIAYASTSGGCCAHVEGVIEMLRGGGVWWGRKPLPDWRNGRFPPAPSGNLRSAREGGKVKSRKRLVARAAEGLPRLPRLCPPLRSSSLNTTALQSTVYLPT